MHRVREQIEIDGPVERIWKAVHRDISTVPRWSKNLVRTEVIGGGPVGVGTGLLYVARLPGGLTQDLHLVVTVYDEFRRCGGTVRGSSMHGTWLWEYRTTGDATRVVYQTDVNLRGMLRFAGRVVEGEVRQDVRRNLEALKEQVEGRLRR